MEAPSLDLQATNLRQATLILSNVSKCSPYKNMVMDHSDLLCDGTDLSGTLYLEELDSIQLLVSTS